LSDLLKSLQAYPALYLIVVIAALVALSIGAIARMLIWLTDMAVTKSVNIRLNDIIPPMKNEIAELKQDLATQQQEINHLSSQILSLRRTMAQGLDRTVKALTGLPHDEHTKITRIHLEDAIEYLSKGAVGGE
jgi:hypothetical protein